MGILWYHGSIFSFSFAYAYMACICGKRTYVHSHVSRLRSTVGVFLDCSSPYIVRQGLSLNPELTMLSRLASQLAPETACLHLPRTRIRAGGNSHPTGGSGNGNSAPHACMASSFLADPSPQPQDALLICFCRHNLTVS